MCIKLRGEIVSRSFRGEPFAVEACGRDAWGIVASDYVWEYLLPQEPETFGPL